MAMFPDHVMHTTAVRAQALGKMWASETPMRIHSHSVAADGSPEWHPEFARWMTRSQRPPALADNPDLRATRVFRQLRKTSKREYEVALRLLLLGDSVAGCTRYLNERAQANGIPLPPDRKVHYRPKDIVALFISAVDFAYSLL